MVGGVWRGLLREPTPGAWCCKPALTEAAAWREVEAARLRDGDGGCGEGDDMMMADDAAEKDVDGEAACEERAPVEGGRELRSGMLLCAV